MGRYDDWVPVVPPTGEARSVARQLLEIAGENRHYVRTDGNGTEFLVHPDVAEAFTAPAAEDKPKTPRKRAARKPAAEPESEE